MADHPKRDGLGPVPIAPKRPLPGQDTLGLSPTSEFIDGFRDPKQPPQQQSNPRRKKAEQSAHHGGNATNENLDNGPDGGEDDHIESAKHVERELPSDVAATKANRGRVQLER
jgi:hypothetical protein